MLACASLLALPASALAQDPAAEIPDIAVSEPQAVTTGPSWGVARASGTPELWATVNICDTADAADSMGVRASMPGNGSDQRMYMRVTAEYWSRARQAWTPVGGSGVSPWVYAGSAEYARRQAGWTFAFAAPPQGVTFTMRAQVEFQWRAVGSQVAKRSLKRAKRALKRTKRGTKRHRRARAKHRRARAKVRRAVNLRRSRGARLRTVRSVTRTTETGITGVHGGDPTGTSKAMCVIF